MSQFNQQNNKPNNFPSEAFADCIANSKQIFLLINSILPLESCLRYQILPLALQSDHLTVGMLEPNDKNALNYICPIATSLGYHLDFKLIDSETHQLILSAYLKEPSPAAKSDRDQTIVDIQPNSGIKDYQKTVIDIQPNSGVKDYQKTVIDIQPNSEVKDYQKTVIDIQPNGRKQDYSVDKSMTLTEMPDDFDFALNFAVENKQEAIKNNEDKNVDKPMASTEKPPNFVPKQPSADFHERPTLLVENEPKLSIPKLNSVSEKSSITNSISDINNVKPENNQVDNYGVLDIPAKPVIESQDFLVTLSPELSYRELLTKALDNDVERLHLVKYSDHGSICGSKNGSVVSSLDRVELTIFNVLLDAIKTLAQIPRSPLTKTKKVAMERLHQQKRVLFRLEFIPNSEGEEVIVLILRGDSLIAYEQQQMDKMGEQVLVTAQKLEKMLKKMQVCFTSARLKNIRDVQRLQQQIDKHLQLLDK